MIERAPRLLAFLPDLDGGGAQRTVVNLANALNGRGPELALAAARGEGPARAWLDPRVPLCDLHAGRLRRALLPLRRLIRRRRPDILFATMVDADIVAAAAAWGLANAPALVLRETNSHRARGDLGPLRRRLIGWAYRRADRVVALSEGVRCELIADYRLHPGRVVTLYNPVDVAGIGARAEAARRAPPPWGEWAEGASVLIGAGRLTRQKGFDLLLKAMARLDHGRARLVLLGEGPEAAALHTLAASLGLKERVLLAGFVADPARWFAHADLFVLASRFEGFGHVLVEAMAAGLPVLATDCPYGPAEIVEPERTGMLVPNDNVEALRRGIDALLADPEKRQSLARAAARAAERFSAEVIAGQYAGLFEEVRSERAGP